MSYVEFSVQVECPHCGGESHECAEFYLDEADQSGCVSRLMKAFCGEDDCLKEFFFKGQLNFEIEVHNTYKKKPAEKP